MISAEEQRPSFEIAGRRISVTAPQPRSRSAIAMFNRDPEKNFEELWATFHHRYPFFESRKVDWIKQYGIYRPKVTSKTGDGELFDIFCQMLDPLDDGHVELKAKEGDKGKKRYFTAEKRPRFY